MPRDSSQFMKLSFPNEPSFDPTSDIMPEDAAEQAALRSRGVHRGGNAFGEPSTLGPADFNRIGVGPKETRLGVIRNAAVRASSGLASKQLDHPNPLTEQQLSRIAVSTYRLLDPRQRDDHKSRADIGRIRPGVLFQVSRTKFAGSPPRSAQDPRAAEETKNASAGRQRLGQQRLGRQGRRASARSNEAATIPSPNGPRAAQNRTQGRPNLDPVEKAAETAPRTPPIAVEDSAQLRTVDCTEETSHSVDSSSGRLQAVRMQIHRPAMILTLIFVLLITAAAVWIWGRNQGSDANLLPAFQSHSYPAS